MSFLDEQCAEAIARGALAQPLDVVTTTTSAVARVMLRVQRDTAVRCARILTDAGREDLALLVLNALRDDVGADSEFARPEI